MSAALRGGARSSPSPLKGDTAGVRGATVDDLLEIPTANILDVSVRNCQRTFSIDSRAFRTIAISLLKELLFIQSAQLGIYFVSVPEITRLNENFVHHAGSTDVITFDYSSPRKRSELHGEIFICVAEAFAQARRFRTTGPSELVRCLVHGILHLLGYDDLKAAARRKMKREENRLTRELLRRFPLRSP